jgi:hypothetical protein
MLRDRVTSGAIRPVPIIASDRWPEAPMHIGTLLLVIWLIIGAIAAGQRRPEDLLPPAAAQPVNRAGRPGRDTR